MPKIIKTGLQTLPLIALALLLTLTPMSVALAQSPFEGVWSGQATQTNNFPAFALTLTIKGVTQTGAMVTRETSQATAPATFTAEIRGNSMSFGDRVQHTLTVEGNTAKVYMRNIHDGTTAEATLTRKPN
ncbi:MAG: hypothetical protein ACRCTD_16930 [Beijerinckiaceae bacterium]